MSLTPDIGRDRAAFPRVIPARPRTRSIRGPVAGVLSAVALAALSLAPNPTPASTPATFDSQPEDLPMLTEEMAALDPLAAEARCRSFLNALYHRHQVLKSNPAWGPEPEHAAPLDWVLDVFFALPPASPGVRAADAAAGDLTRRYLDAFGPAAVPNSLPDDPLYLNDKIICEGVLGLGGQ